MSPKFRKQLKKQKHYENTVVKKRLIIQAAKLNNEIKRTHPR